uniref:Uncharacterized protein n=1 Tax=Oryza nivara TaxID=4536 RepID=A0A0E0IUF2_ORYNI
MLPISPKITHSWQFQKAKKNKSCTRYSAPKIPHLLALNATVHRIPSTSPSSRHGSVAGGQFPSTGHRQSLTITRDPPSLSAASPSKATGPRHCPIRRPPSPHRQVIAPLISRCQLASTPHRPSFRALATHFFFRG